MSELATDDEIFADLEGTEPVPFEFANGKVVYVEKMGLGAFIGWQREVIKAERTEDGFDPSHMARLIVWCVTDGKGKLRWSPASVPRLMNGRADKLLPLFDLCCRVNGLDAQSRADAKKNSNGVLTSTSSTASPGTSENHDRPDCSAELAASPA